MTKIQITQATSQFPLLRALDAAPNGTLDSDAAVTAALAEMGGDPADKAHRTAVGNGKWDLKARGCVVDASRGVWSISDLGRNALKDGKLPPQDREKYLGAPVPRGTAKAATPAVETPAVETPVVETPVVETPAVETPKRRLKVATTVTAPPAEIPSFLSDDEIRAMIVEGTDCFGAWSAKSGECGKCPLAGWCRNAKAATLTLLASKLTTETPAHPEPVKASVAKLDAAVGAANAPDAPRTSVDVGMTLKARHDGVCAVSGRPIKAGDSIKYLPSFGLYHANETPPADAVSIAE